MFRQGLLQSFLANVICLIQVFTFRIELRWVNLIACVRDVSDLCSSHHVAQKISPLNARNFAVRVDKFDFEIKPVFSGMHAHASTDQGSWAHHGRKRVLHAKHVIALRLVR